MKKILLVSALSVSLFACKQEAKETENKQEISPAVAEKTEDRKSVV